jgi:hypothetical protein
MCFDQCWSSSGIKIVWRGDCCLLFLLMLLNIQALSTRMRVLCSVLCCTWECKELIESKCAASTILLHLIILMISGVDYNLWNYPLRSIFPVSTTSAASGPNILFSLLIHSHSSDFHKPFKEWISPKQIKVKSKLCYDRRSIGKPVVMWSPTWGLTPDFFYCQKISSLLIWGALSDDRTGLSFTNTVGTRESHYYILLSQVRDSPNLEGQVSEFISSRNRVVQLYPQALSSLFIVFYDS